MDFCSYKKNIRTKMREIIRYFLFSLEIFIKSKVFLWCLCGIMLK